MSKGLVTYICRLFCTVSICFYGVLFSANTLAQEKMSLTDLKGIISAVSDVEEAGDNYMQFLFKNVRLVLIADETADRMRLISPIVKVDKMETQDLYIVMESNYHQALDARYATSNGVLYSVFIHPLSPLDETQVMSALSQVATLAITYGSHYTSGELSFGESFSKDDETTSDSEDSNSAL